MASPISATVWKRIFDGYVNGGTIQAAAKYAGVADLTAAKYIKNGDPAQGLEPIEKMLRDQNMALVAAHQKKLMRELEGYRTLASIQLQRVAQALGKTDIDIGSNTNAAGNVTISPKEYLRLHSLAKSNFAFAMDVDEVIENGGKRPRNTAQQVQVGVNVEVNDLYASAYSKWQQMERQTLSDEELKLSPTQRAELLARRAKKARVQKGNGTPVKKRSGKKAHKLKRIKHSAAGGAGDGA